MGQSVNKKVNFLIGGVQKGGTTALSNFLRQHPQISFPKEKEIHFFDLRRRYKKGTEWYHSNFVFKYGCLVGESSPFYMYWKPCSNRIKRYNPKMKWIFLLRNPIDRAYSHYKMERGRREKLSFLDAINIENERLAHSRFNQHWSHAYITRGFYSIQIKHILKDFPIEQMLFIKTDDLKNKHFKTLNTILDFLKLDRTYKIQPNIFSTNNGPMEYETRKFLSAIYEQEIVDLEQLININFHEWSMDVDND